jgi:hypothetical protein
MKNWTKIILIVSLLTFIIGVLFAYNGQRIFFLKGKTKYIVVMNAFFNPSKIYKPNAAILITKEQEIAYNEKLFINNNPIGHLCGYHYRIQFWNSPENQIKNVPFNQECEVFLRNNDQIQLKMKSYFKILETKPTHYIYNLQISGIFEPKEILKSFENTGFHLFFMDGVTNHYPTLEFTYLQVTPIKNIDDRTKWQSEQDENQKRAIHKINAIVDTIKNITTIIEQTNISFPFESFGGSTIQHKGAITLKFKNGSDLHKVKEIIERNNGKVTKEHYPEYYYVQLVDKSENLEEIKQKLKNFKMITHIFEYPQTQ